MPKFVDGKRVDPDSTPKGNCVNPECGHPLRTNGRMTPETEGMRRGNRQNVCVACQAAGFTVQEFNWTPELLGDAVKHAMGELFRDVA